MILASADERKLLQEFFNARLLDDDEFNRFLYLHHGKGQKPINDKINNFSCTTGFTPSPLTFKWYNAISEMGKWGKELENDIWKGKDVFVNKPLTRPGKAFVRYFVNVCLNINSYRKDPEKIAEVSEYLRFIKWTTSPPTVLLKLCLNEILRNPIEYHKHLKKLQELANTKTTSYEMGCWLEALGKDLRDRWNQKIDKKNTEKTISLPEQAPIAMPNWQTLPTFPKDTVDGDSPLWSIKELNSLFEVREGKVEEQFPDLKIQDQGLERHQKHQIEQFNKAKNTFYKEMDQCKIYSLKDPKQLKENLDSFIKSDKEWLTNKKAALLRTVNALPAGPDKALKPKFTTKINLNR